MSAPATAPTRQRTFGRGRRAAEQASTNVDEETAQQPPLQQPSPSLSVGSPNGDDDEFWDRPMLNKHHRPSNTDGLKAPAVIAMRLLHRSPTQSRATKIRTRAIAERGTEQEKELLGAQLFRKKARTTNRVSARPVRRGARRRG